jgi:hypothetical protein
MFYVVDCFRADTKTDVVFFFFYRFREMFLFVWLGVMTHVSDGVSCNMLNKDFKKFNFPERCFYKYTTRFNIMKLLIFSHAHSTYTLTALTVALCTGKSVLSVSTKLTYISFRRNAGFKSLTYKYRMAQNSLDTRCLTREMTCQVIFAPYCITVLILDRDKAINQF